MVNKNKRENQEKPEMNEDTKSKGHERKGKKVEEKVVHEQTLEMEEPEKEVLEEGCNENTEKKGVSLNSEEEDNKTRYLRLAADFANYKKRSEKERSSIHAYANEKLVTDMLDILDNFDRALLQEGNGKDTFKEGMELIYKQLLGILQRAGLSEIVAKGQPFDPEFHEALMMEPSDEYESGLVIEVLKRGYMLNKKVIRHTLVKVAQ